MERNKQSTVDGMYRLLAGPRDLQRWDFEINDPGKENASSGHKILYKAYKDQLTIIARKVEKIWDQEINWLTSQLGSEKEAISKHLYEFPAGPAAQPEFIEYIRMNWLKCNYLNKNTTIHEAVAPETLLLKWLSEEIDVTDTSIKVICCMPYWPLGLDEDDNWC